ncbi:MAG: hypothetical protein K0Q73_7502 [Paenibacillus sp.]|jgi:hypothetical protein|nr:hypothetical protein [Paenibacillus sp.]
MKPLKNVPEKEPSELETLVTEKTKLWDEVKDNPDFLNTPQYKRIDVIDARLWELV